MSDRQLKNACEKYFNLHVWEKILGKKFLLKFESNIYVIILCIASLHADVEN